MAGTAGERREVGAFKLGVGIGLVLFHNAVEHLEYAAAFFLAKPCGTIAVALFGLFCRSCAARSLGSFCLEAHKAHAVGAMAAAVPRHSAYQKQR